MQKTKIETWIIFSPPPLKKLNNFLNYQLSLLK